MARVRLLCGPHRSNRTRQIDRLVRAALGHAVLIVPTHEYAQRRREQLLLESDVAGIWGNPVTTFRDFALQLVRAENLKVDELSDLERRLLLERAVAQLRQRGKLEALGASADTRGFVTHLLRTITQLKQAAVDPAVFRRHVTARPKPSWLDPIVADAYDAYQEALRDTKAYDLVGLYWQAALLLQAGNTRGLDAVRLVALDGFDDFTPSEFRLIKELAPHLETLAFGVACSQASTTQRDLYAVPLRTLSRIQATFEVTPIECEEAPPETHAAFAASSIFWRDMPRNPQRLRPNLELLPCSGVIQEAETIARRAKALILDRGVAPDQIAVVHRDLAGVADTLLGVFSEMGVPVRIKVQPRLSESAVGRFLLRVLTCIANWEHEAVVDVLTSPWFAPELPIAAHRDVVRLLARTARIVRGYDEWEKRLQALQRRVESGQGEAMERLRAHHPNASEALQTILDALALLRGLQGELVRCRDGAALVEGIQTLIERTGVPRGLAAIEGAYVRQAEANALTAINRALTAYAAWQGRAETARALEPGDLLTRTRQILDDAVYPLPQPRAGVACLDAESIRHLDFEYVFLAGMNEGAFPRAAATSAIYTDEDLRNLRELGIDLDTRRQQADREMLLFHHVLSSARTGLCVSWATQSREGREAAPSPFVVDLRDLFPGDTLPAPVAESFVPTAERIASWRDLRCVAVAQGAQLAPPLDAALDGVLARATCESRRYSAAPFDQHDGVLGSPELVAAVAERFGPAHTFSVNQLEAYAECPFRFFVERVLAVSETESPVVEFDPMVRGSILHEILQRFHEANRGKPLAELDEVAAIATLHELVDAVLDQRSWESQTAPTGVVRVERERLKRQLERYFRLGRENDEPGWSPSHFEVAFGKVRDASGDPLNSPEPFVLDTEDGPVAFSGKIDRIDLNEDAARIVDYKSHVYVSQADIEAGVSLQLPLYALALERHLMPEQVCEQAILLAVGAKRTVECLSRQPRRGAMPWPERQVVLRDKVAEYIRAIRAGCFPPVPYESSSHTACRLCPGRSVCRYEQVRIARKEVRSV